MKRAIMIDQRPSCHFLQDTVSADKKNTWLLFPNWDINGLQAFFLHLNFPAQQMIVVQGDDDCATQIYCQYKGIHYLSFGAPRPFSDACRAGLKEALAHAAHDVLILKNNIDFSRPGLWPFLMVLCNDESDCILLNHEQKTSAEEYYHLARYSMSAPTVSFTWQQNTLLMKLSLAHWPVAPTWPLVFAEIAQTPLPLRQLIAKNMRKLGARLTQYGKALESSSFLAVNYRSFIFLKNKVLRTFPRHCTKAAPAPTAIAPVELSMSATEPFLQGLATNDIGEYPLREQWYSATQPKVSIIILNYNKADLALRCVKEVWRHTHSFFYEIIVLDNGSEWPDYQQLKNLDGAYCQLIRLAINRYFPEGNNIAAEFAKGHYLFFLNNDAFVTDNWLAPLVKRMDEDRDIGIIGPMFLYPDGRLQEAGCTVTATETLMIGEGDDPHNALYNIEKEVDYISAAGILVRKTDFDEVLGYDFFWGIGYYEDVDLAFKMKSLQKKIIYCPLSKIIHIKNATTKTYASFVHSTIYKNQIKFFHRWENAIKNGFFHHACSHHQHRQMTVRQTQRSVGIYMPGALSIEGQQKYLLVLVAHLSYRQPIVLFFAEKYSLHALRSCMNVFGLQCADVQIDTYEHAKNYQFDTFIVAAAPSVPLPSGCTTVYVHLKSGEIKCPFFCDVMLVPALPPGHETKAPAQAVYVTGVPGIKEQYIQSPVIKPSGPIRTMSVQHFSKKTFHSYVTMIQTFLKLYYANTALPIELHLLGALDDYECIQALKKMTVGVPVHFYLNSSVEILYSLYQSAHIYWQGADLSNAIFPTADNAMSFKLPILEAMSFGCVPIVYPGPAAIDYVTPTINGFICTTEQEFIDHSQGLIRSPLQLAQLSSRAIERSRYFSEEKFLHRILRACNLHTNETVI